MDKIMIKGGERLIGEVAVSGSKNAALPLFAASLLAEGDNVLNNVPNLRDIDTMSRVLRNLGVKVERATRPVGSMQPRSQVMKHPMIW